jgi:hypothetical protein
MNESSIVILLGKPYDMVTAAVKKTANQECLYLLLLNLVHCDCDKIKSGSCHFITFLSDGVLIIFKIHFTFS